MVFSTLEHILTHISFSIVSIVITIHLITFLVDEIVKLYDLAIEPQSLCFYVIATSKRKSEFSTEVDSKYLMLGAFPSGILLFGYDRTTFPVLGRKIVDLNSF